ncbi:MAG: ribosome maturation factor RimP [Actinomyces urogenitalis]|uniref:ribosome maturation factor RimP n=1 Tax=Actinomyces urogenitalis TaxID=103621 RepID=UPI002A804954|nr:ribosome maturation factor RimP [Actinomyces urogenitalis]MDY3678065.1 ribosome maturation factor RimP [Actinomyces urogenitalis]
MADTLSTATTERLTELLTPVVEQAGLFLEGVEATRAGRYSTVRVIVDLPDGPGDLDLDTVAEVTQAVSDALDEADPVKGQYTLEVTSPGAERELTTPRTFRRATGHQARLVTAGQTLTGTVRSADEEAVTVEVDGSEQTIAYTDLLEARMVVVF